MKRLLRPADLALEYSIPIQTSDRWRKSGLGPRWFREGRNIFYRLDDVEAWAAEQASVGAASGDAH